MTTICILVDEYLCREHQLIDCLIYPYYLSVIKQSQRTNRTKITRQNIAQWGLHCCSVPASRTPCHTNRLASQTASRRLALVASLLQLSASCLPSWTALPHGRFRLMNLRQFPLLLATRWANRVLEIPKLCRLISLRHVLKADHPAVELAWRSNS